MEEKVCCGIYDFDGVLLPGEELMDVYVQKINREASNAYCEELFKEQAVLLKQKQELEDELDLYDLEDWEKEEIRENDYDVTDVIEDAIESGDLDEDEEYW